MNKNILSLTLVTVLFFGCFISCRAQSYTNDNPAYVIYDAKGKKVSYGDMMKAAAKSDVCLFGELHNDPISHWLELCIAEDLFRIKKDKLVIGAEMWETDNQLVLDEYRRGLIDLDTYIENSKMWPNFSTDYLPVFRFAGENGIPFVATNVPRRYARMVSRDGIHSLDSLDSEALRYLAPLPLEVDYEQVIYKLIGESFKQMGEMPMKKETVRNLVDAQAIKDATMAHFILKNMKTGGTFFHFHGEFHSAFHSAIEYYIGKYAPGTRVLTISMHTSDDPFVFETARERADYNIVVPDKMTNTYVD